jgi:hypothetical protein
MLSCYMHTYIQTHAYMQYIHTYIYTYTHTHAYMQDSSDELYHSSEVSPERSFEQGPINASVYKCLCLYVCMCVCMCHNVCIFVCIPMCVCAFVYFVYTEASDTEFLAVNLSNACVCVRACVHVSMHVCIFVCMRTASFEDLHKGINSKSTMHVDAPVYFIYSHTRIIHMHNQQKAATTQAWSTTHT